MGEKQVIRFKSYLQFAATLLVAGTFVGIANGEPSSAAKSLAAKWTASDRPYDAVFDDIVAKHKRGVPTDVIVLEYKAKADANPKDPVAQFGYVLITKWQFQEQHPASPLPYDLVTRLKSVDPGNVYLLASYEFTMTQDADHILPLSEIETTGGALLIHRPHDRYAYRALIYELRDAVGGTDEGLRYAKQWVAWDGSNPDSHLLLGDLYQCEWLEGKETNSYFRTMFHSEFNTVLSMAPKGSSDANVAQLFLKAAAHEGG
jgi:hypothetical protein